MYNSVPISWHIVSYVINYLVVFRMRTTEGLACLYVRDCGLLGLDPTPGLTVSGIESGLFPVSREANCFCIEGMKPC